MILLQNHITPPPLTFISKSPISVTSGEAWRTAQRRRRDGDSKGTRSSMRRRRLPLEVFSLCYCPSSTNPIPDPSSLSATATLLLSPASVLLRLQKMPSPTPFVLPSSTVIPPPSVFPLLEGTSSPSSFSSLYSYIRLHNRSLQVFVTALWYNNLLIIVNCTAILWIFGFSVLSVCVFVSSLEYLIIVNCTAILVDYCLVLSISAFNYFLNR